MVADEGQVIDDELLARIKQLRDNPEIEVSATRLQAATSRQLLDLFGTRETITEITAESFSEPGITQGEFEYNLFLAADLLDPDAKKPLSKAYSHIDSETIDKILRVNPPSIDVYRTPAIITGALVLDKVKEERGREEDAATMEMMALSEVHKNLRPGDPPTQESARSLLNSFFFDPSVTTWAASVVTS
jgi:DNA-directed RNA polymerase subunit beta